MTPDKTNVQKTFAFFIVSDDAVIFEIAVTQTLGKTSFGFGTLLPADSRPDIRHPAATW